MISPTRRTFVTACSAALVTPPMAASAATILRRMDGGLPASFPTHDPDVVRELVGAAHTDPATVERLVTAQPELSRAAWDWGFGDWESALGAASHMGRRDIAEILFRNGARPDHFTFAMLGQVDAVRAICEANPGIQRMPGPHGITLMQHARAGKAAAASVVAYLQELGDADQRQPNLSLGEVDSEPYLGRFRPAVAPDVVFHVEFHPRRKVVTLRRDEMPVRFLLFHGNDEFHPSGAPTVRVSFGMRGGRAYELRIADGRHEIAATRLP